MLEVKNGGGGVDDEELRAGGVRDLEIDAPSVSPGWCCHGFCCASVGVGVVWCLSVRSDEDEDDKEEDDPPFAWLLPLLLLTVMLALSWCLACSSRWPARSLSTCSARRRALPLTDTSKASRSDRPSEASRRGDRIDGAPDEDEDEDDEKEKKNRRHHCLG